LASRKRQKMANVYDDLLYDENNGVATITINRPEKLNAFGGKTCVRQKTVKPYVASC